MSILIEVGPIPVFGDIERCKEQGVKLLEEASECREAYENIRKEIEGYEKQFGCQAQKLKPFPDSRTLGQLSFKFSMEMADVLQVLINMAYTLYGDEAEFVFETAVENMIAKNNMRGRYAREEKQG